ncbi:FMR1-interacting protein NUFIP1 [Uranotaenia lowii]|uniref:FMR1-interacting protein NUFIP1 n=1 Tax=Uranotaenia lowii TaxID=190385 RepID=UPI0024791508|nr:FMR1-interacting protein NUFIP1 [Uranotaenia lowii]
MHAGGKLKRFAQSMDISKQNQPFRLPTPKFQDETSKSLDNFNRHRNPHFSTPSGMLMPRHKQPPPMYGPRGATVPPKFFNQQQQKHQNACRGRGGHRGGGHFHSSRGFRGSSVEDRDVIPELLLVNWNYWCEGCDINCRSEEELKHHRSAHVPCPIEGCTYVGHSGVMKRHYRLAHDVERLQQKAEQASKETPEEIEKWRAERRRRFPTTANVLQRQRAQEERFQRGERIEEDKSRFPRKNNREYPQHQQQQKDQPNIEQSTGSSRSRRRKKPFTKLEEPVEKIENVRQGFGGTSKMKDYRDEPKNALNLLSGYGSDSSSYSSSEPDEHEETNAEVIQQTIVASNEKDSVPLPTRNPESIDISDDETLEEEAAVHQSNELVQKTKDGLVARDEQILKDETEKSNEEHSKSRRNRNRKRRGSPQEQIEPESSKQSKPLLDYRKLYRAKQNTLLEKLLEPDIRHERNILLQCVRFVVENKFFGIGQPKNNPSADTKND